MARMLTVESRRRQAGIVTRSLPTTGVHAVACIIYLFARLLAKMSPKPEGGICQARYSSAWRAAEARGETDVLTQRAPPSACRICDEGSI